MILAVNLLVIVVGVLVCGLGWFFNNPVPEGYKDPWKLRKIMAKLQILNYQLFNREKTETVRDIYISRRPAAVAPPDPRISEINVKSQDLVFDGVSVRLYVPEGLEEEDQSPAIVYYHGGGFMLGSVSSYDHFCRSFAHGSRVKLVSVDYRRAPEHIYPVPLDDCVTATIHFIAHAKDFGVDTTRIAVAGDSAGGNLAAATALRLRDQGVKPKPKLQILIVPMLQTIDFKSSSFQRFETDPLLPKRIIASSWHLYAMGNADHLEKLMNNEHTTPEIKQKLYSKQLKPDNIPDDLKGEGYVRNKMDFGDADVWEELKSIFLDPYYAPLMSDNLNGLPEAIVMTMGQDVLRDDGIWYAKYLKSFGVKVTHCHYDAGYHAVVTWPVLYQENVYDSRAILCSLVREKL